jgi:hypothetical protein
MTWSNPQQPADPVKCATTARSCFPAVLDLQTLASSASVLSQVNGNVEKLLEKGSLVAFGVTFPKTGASMMALEMNETRWWLRPDMATLKAGLCTYMLDVTQPGSQAPTFFCITFADDTLPEVRLHFDHYG